MTRYGEHDGLGEHSIQDELRDAIGSAGEAHFDYDALVAGTKVRARRLRRRRTAAQGVAAAVLVPTLVGTGWLIGNNLDGTRDASLDLADTTQSVTERLPDDAVGTSAPAPTGKNTDVAVETAGPERAPWQPVDPPEPAQPDASDGPHSNWMPLPDPRPTGIPFLDALTVQGQISYARTAPLSFYVGQLGDGGTEPTGIEAHSGVLWMYHDGTNTLDQATVDIAITAWYDAPAAMHAIRTDEPTDYSWVWTEPDPTAADPDETVFVRGVPDPLTWPGHEGDDDYLLVETPSDPSAETPATAGALIRQGDYLVGVTVQASTVDEARAAAAEIAEKTAANLVYFEPYRAQD